VTMEMETAKENLAQQKQAKPLPKGDCVPSKDRRYQDVPQALDDETKDNCSDDDKGRNFYSSKYRMMTHG
jgi:hypothetical protein